MLIDRSNYELWLIDWLDGNLSRDEIETVMSFLESNPDIREEFNEMASLNLKPQEAKFRGKKPLKKSLRELSVSQFEYLSIAYLENDLLPPQLKELNEIIEMDPEKAHTHALIQKTKLNPLELRYDRKFQLIRRSVKQRVIRLSIIGLSAAATIGFIIISNLFIPGSNTNDTGRDGMHSVSTITPIVDTNGTHYDSATIQPNLRSNGFQSISATNPAIPGDGKFSVSTTTPIADTNGTHYAAATSPNDSRDGMHSVSTVIRPVSHEKIIFQPNIDLKIKPLNNSLIASTFVSSIPSFDDERSNIKRFFARNFRQKLLREKDSKDTPLKGYEIAEAGVNGLNKLLGWQMALNTVNNENGEPESVYFTSKLLKFNTPVKKNQ
jgi:hypothetical protein